MSNYPEGVKEFWVYTGLRALLFLGSFALVLAVWLLVADTAELFFVAIIALVLSGIGSYFLLSAPRQAFARRVEQRAESAKLRFEERKARED
ncbi:DUF4229 domain-containing protein [Nocardioides pantholopis]|uniref:DUF4229 domain-containing protein n=1 Tax=Nocardioides pantholopis TaxID=2483798 RepID=UPI001F493E2C|nr:DUF4229 domain-containing protein [Nocardioides pantholopis]